MNLFLFFLSQKNLRETFNGRNIIEMMEFSKYHKKNSKRKFLEKKKFIFFSLKPLNDLIIIFHSFFQSDIFSSENFIDFLRTIQKKNCNGRCFLDFFKPLSRSSLYFTFKLTQSKKISNFYFIFQYFPIFFLKNKIFFKIFTKKAFFFFFLNENFYQAKMNKKNLQKKKLIIQILKQQKFPPRFFLNFLKFNFSSIVQKFFFFNFFILEFLLCFQKIINSNFCCLKMRIVYSEFFKLEKNSFKNFPFYLILIFLQSLDIQKFNEQIVNLKKIFIEKQTSFFFFSQNFHPLLCSLEKKLKAKVFY